MKLWKHIKAALAVHSNQKVFEADSEMTYEELLIFAETYAERLRGESSCAVICRSELATAMGLLACFAAEVSAIPISLRYGATHTKRIVDFIRPSSFITDVDGKLDFYRLPPAYISPQNRPAVIMFSSGTTGNPKGIMLGEEGILANVSDICHYLNVGTSDSFLIARPLCHAAVLTGEFLTAITKGASIRFHSEAFQPHEILSLASKHRCTVLCGTPTLLSLLARYRRKSTPLSLKTICISGECMSAETGLRIADAFEDANIYHVYGLTEASPRVSYLPPKLFRTHPDCVGIPLPSVKIKILKEDGTQATVGEDGILYVKGPNIMLGYYLLPTATAKVLSDGWLSTGDIAMITEEGLMKIKGRSDDMIIRAGINIYPQEVEGVMKEDPRVKDVLVYSYEDPIVGVGIGMKISGDFASTGEVKALAKNLLPPYEVPTKIELLPELSRNEFGKIKRKLRKEQNNHV